MDVKTQKHVDNLFRNSKQMGMASIAGLIFPIVLIVAAPLGLLYAAQRSSLLKKIDSGEIDLSGDKETASKVDYLREHNLHFFVPTIVVGVVILAIAMIVVFAGSK